MTDDSEPTDETHGDAQTSNRPLVFISHDSRDATLAKAFSDLLRSISTGMLKSFRSSDKTGSQGIEYGIEWYPELMKKVKSARDVVCLLTQRSLGRPWILYEAGVAKGKLDTDIAVHGLALGIPLTKASTGPFAQFQNCGDDVELMTSLVLQLVRRLPDADPDPDTVRMHVEAFKGRVVDILAESDLDETGEDENHEVDSSPAKLFEEIKVMFQDLPSRVESMIDRSDREPFRRGRRLHPMELEESVHFMGREAGREVAVLIVASYIRDDVPWLYELGVEAYRDARGRNKERANRSMREFVRAADLIAHGPLSRLMRSNKDMYMLIRELPMILDTFGLGNRQASDNEEESGDLEE